MTRAEREACGLYVPPLRLWADVPEADRVEGHLPMYAPLPDRASCEAAIGRRRWNSDQWVWRRCLIPAAPGATLCWMHGGPRMAPPIVSAATKLLRKRQRELASLKARRDVWAANLQAIEAEVVALETELNAWLAAGIKP